MLAVWTNWDPLEEVIVGDCYEPGSLDWLIPKEAQDNFNTILKETKEDLDNLASFLESLNVKVYRPDVTQYKNNINLSNFQIANPTAPIVPRDQYLVYGDTIYQTYTSMPDRYLDSVNYYKIFKKLFNDGYNWLSMPPPVLKNLDETDKWWNKGDTVYKELSNQLLWHTATMFKCGDTLIVNDKGPGTLDGLSWMSRNIIDSKLIKNNNTTMNNWGHIDHGFFMTDDDTVFCKNIDWVPICLRNKDIYEIGETSEDESASIFCEKYNQYGGKYSADWINEWCGYEQKVNFDTNVLVIDSKNIITSAYVPELHNALRSKGIECHIVNQRQSGFWEGGIHCMTLDIKRKGNKRKIINE
jgi:hypothetical protein